MDFDENERKLLKLYEIFQFKADNEESTTAERANAIQSLMLQLNTLYENKKITYEEYKSLICHHEQLYCNVVDEQDCGKGMNNYAEQSIQLASTFNNDSKNWKSSLTFESLNNFNISDIQAKDYDRKSQQKENKKSLQSNLEKSDKKTLFLSVTDEQTTNQTQFKADHSHSSTNKASSSTIYQKNDCQKTDVKARNEEFVTAREQFILNEKKKGNYGASKKSLGYTRRSGTASRFVPPVRQQHDDRSTSALSSNATDHEVIDERLKGIEPRMIELINNEIMDHGPPITWDDIAGLEFAKTVIKEIVVWPMLRPDLFKGLRGPPKGLLLFGPPGTGKTLIGKCIASQSKATFFTISASSLTSKWVGEGEKMVRALFAVARCHQPAVIFIDEIDSLLSQRSDTEHESSRRIKTEFLIQLDGATTSYEDRLLVVGATNRPQEIDEAARRRLVKRLYIPLPEGEARKQIITNLLKGQQYSLSDDDLTQITERSEGYSGSDMSNLCHEAALGPIRSISGNIQTITSDQVRPIIFDDFDKAFMQVRASVTSHDLNLYTQWNKQFGSG